MSWSESQSHRYYDVNLLMCSAFQEFYKDYLGPICENKDVLDLGCGDGTLSEIISHRNWINVDPYTRRPDRVLSQDANTYLTRAPPNSFDIILCMFAIHNFVTPAFPQRVRKALRNGGNFLNCSISANSPIFGDEDFNRVFFQTGFPKDTIPYSSLSQKNIIVGFWATELSEFIRNRSWSNLTMMSEKDIDALLDKIPEDLTEITLTIDIGVLNK